MKRIHINTFHNRMIISFIILITIPVTIYASIFYFRQNRLQLNDTTLNLQQTVDQNIKLLEEKLIETDKKTWPLFTSNSLEIFNERFEDMSYNYYKRFYSFKKDILLSVTGDTTDVKSINFISKNRNYFSSDSMVIRPENISQTIEREIFSKLEKKPLKMIWMGEDRPLLSNDWSRQETGQKQAAGSSINIMAVKKIISTKTGQELGIIIINFKNGFLKSILGTGISGINARVLVVDEDNRYLYGDSPGLPLQKVDPAVAALIAGHPAGHGKIILGGEKYLGVYNTSVNSGWKVLLLVTENDLFAKNREFFQSTIIIIVTVSIAFVIAATVFAFWISRPITEIKSVMEAVADEGDLDARIKLDAIYEFQILAARFNRMMDRIKQLLEENREIEKEKNLAKIEAMQMQVNPHFLYNTLNSIYALSKQYGIQPIMDMTYSLSVLFRAIFSKTSEYVTIQEDIDHLEHYLTIQKIRFKNKFSVIYEIDDEVYHCKIPGLMLQMLVENSIVHGIEKKKGKGEIDITAFVQNGNVKIIVRDDGIGIEPDRLDKIKEALDNQDSENNEGIVALRSINRRLKLNYGNDFGLSIFSISGKGTTVEMLLPYIA